MHNSNITGRLLNARRVRIGRFMVLEGNVYEDVRGRFHDGQWVRTSEIVSEDGSVVYTRNNIYEVEGWADEWPDFF